MPSRHVRVLQALLVLIVGALRPVSAVAASTPCTDSVLGATSVHLCIIAPSDGAQAAGVLPVSATVQVTGRDPVRAVAFSVDGTYALADLEPDLPARRHGPQVYRFDLLTQRWPDGPRVLSAQAWMR